MQVGRNSGQMSGAPDWKGDPLLHLNEACVVHILSFVIGAHHSGSVSSEAPKQERPWYDPEEPHGSVSRAGGAETKWDKCDAERNVGLLVGVREVGSFYFQHAYLSRDWKAFIDKWIAYLAPRLEADFDNLNPNPGAAMDCILWTERHKFEIESIKCVKDSCFGGCPRLRDIPLLLFLFIACDTSRLTTLQIQFESDKLRPFDGRGPPQWQPPDSLFLTEPQFWENPEEHPEMLRAILWKHCPHIKTLLLSIDIEFDDEQVRMRYSPELTFIDREAVHSHTS